MGGSLGADANAHNTPHTHTTTQGLSGQNPLIGKNIDELGPRFPPVSDAYDFELRILLIQAAARLHLLPILREGVYTFVAGPSFETRAEARYIRDVGGDCVGMSTVPEVLVARHAGVRVLGLSLITNKVSVSRGRSAVQEALRLTSLQAARANGASTSQLERVPSVQDELTTANHEEVLASSAQSALDLQRLVVEWVRSLPEVVVPLAN
jgi:purine-nucleoside phosphorylase